MLVSTLCGWVSLGNSYCCHTIFSIGGKPTHIKEDQLMLSEVVILSANRKELGLIGNFPQSSKCSEFPVGVNDSR